MLKNLIYIEVIYGLALCLAVSASPKGPGRSALLLASPMILLAPAMAFLSPTIPLIHLGLFALVVGLGRTRGITAGLGVAGFLVTPGFSFDVTLAGFDVISIELGTTLASAGIVALLSRHGGTRQKLTWLDFACLSIIVITAIEAGRGTSVTNIARAFFDQTITYGAPYFLVSRALRSKRDITDFFHVVIAAGTALALLLIYEALASWPLYRPAIERFGAVLEGGDSVKIRAGWLRAAGPIIEPTSAAFVASLCLIAAVAQHSTFRSPALACCVRIVLLVGMLAPQSRAAVLGSLIGTIAVFAYRGRAVRTLIAAACALVTAALLLSVVGGTGRVNAYFTAGSQTGLDDYRNRLLTRGIEEFTRHPILGTAKADIYRRLGDLTQGEGIVDFVNAYLYVALFSGGVGLLVFMAALASYLYLPWRFRSALTRHADRSDPVPSLAAFAFAATSASSVMLFTTWLGGRHLTFLFMVFGASKAASLYSGRLGQRRLPSPDIRAPVLVK